MYMQLSPVSLPQNKCPDRSWPHTGSGTLRLLQATNIPWMPLWELLPKSTQNEVGYSSYAEYILSL